MKARQELRVLRELGLQDFDRDEPIKALLASKEDLSHAALAQLSDEAESADLLDYQPALFHRAPHSLPCPLR